MPPGCLPRCRGHDHSPEGLHYTVHADPSGPKGQSISTARAMYGATTATQNDPCFVRLHLITDLNVWSLLVINTETTIEDRFICKAYLVRNSPGFAWRTEQQVTPSRATRPPDHPTTHPPTSYGMTRALITACIHF